MQFEADIIIFLQTFFKNLIWLFMVVTQLGGAVGIIIIGIIFFVKDKKYSIFYVILSGLCSGLNALVKLITNRQRPYITYSQIYNYLPAMGSSMPSSHTIIITLSTVFLIYYVNKYYKKFTPYIIPIGIFMIICIIISRMVLGQHYITDCLVGLVCGLIIAKLSLLVYNKKICLINFKK